MESGYSRASLSFHDNPQFRDLVCTLTDPADDRPITFVCGAGLSRSAGLPDWTTLVHRMCGEIEVEELAPLLRADPVDVMRKADYILRLATTHRTVAEVVRACLYRSGAPTEPGPLADSIARLVKALRGRVRLVTTNFDNQLELALERNLGGPAMSFGLRDRAEWEDETERSRSIGGCPPVLHVHGMVVDGRDAIEPIVLSESYFLRYGRDVRDVVAGELRGGHVVFVGVSMADPNLVGPLSDVRDTLGEGAPRAFVIVVPDHLPEFSREGTREEVERLWAYASHRCAHLAENLGVTPVLLKAYSEVPQVMYDLALAHGDRQRYLDDEPLTSRRYGHRLARVLDRAYQHLGAREDEDFVEGAEQRALSDRLHGALVAPDGPEGRLRAWIESLNWNDLAERFGLPHGYFQHEHFGLFLWLRARSRRPWANEAPPFQIELVGSSAYAHREHWSGARSVPIVPGRVPAGDVAFHGDAISTNTTDLPGFPVWRSTVAVPIIWPSPHVPTTSEDGYLSIGVAAFQSNRPIVEDIGALEDAHRGGGAVATRYAPSAMTFLTGTQKSELRAAIHRAGARVLFEPAQPTPG